MAEYTIITDSSCDLTDEMAQKLEVKVVPLSLTMEGKHYYNTTDERGIAHKELYARLRAGRRGQDQRLQRGGLSGGDGAGAGRGARHSLHRVFLGAERDLRGGRQRRKRADAEVSRSQHFGD